MKVAEKVLERRSTMNAWRPRVRARYRWKNTPGIWRPSPHSD